MSLVKKVSLVSLAVALAFGGLAAYRYHDLKKRMEEIKNLPPSATNSLRVQVDPGLFSAKVVYSYETASPLFLKIVETGKVNYGLGYILTGNVTGDFDIYIEQNSKRLTETPVAKSTFVLKSNNDIVEKGTILAVAEKMQAGSYEIKLTENLSRIDATVNPGNIDIKNNGSALHIEGTSVAVGINLKNWTDSLFKLNIAKFQMSPGLIQNISVSMHDEKAGTKRNFFTEFKANTDFVPSAVPEQFRKMDIDFSASVEGVSETPYLLLIQLLKSKDSIEPELFKTKTIEFSQAIVSAGLTMNVKKAAVKTSLGDEIDLGAVLNLPALDTKSEEWSHKVSAKMNFNLKGYPAEFIYDFSEGAFSKPADAEKFSLGYVNSEVQFNDKTASPEQMVLVRRLLGFFQQPR